MPDHVHMMTSIPPKYAVSQVIGYIKGKSAIHLARVYGERKRNFIGQHFWARGYFVSTVGRDEAVIRESAGLPAPHAGRRRADCFELSRRHQYSPGSPRARGLVRRDRRQRHGEPDLAQGEERLGRARRAVVWTWFQAKPQWFQIAGVVAAAFSLGLLAYSVREVVKSKLYPIAELIFGAGWGAVQATDKVAAAIAFIGSVRIIIDGYKRSFEHRSYRLFSFARILYNSRNFKRWARSFSHN
jgi:transposase IS200 family protein